MNKGLNMATKNPKQPINARPPKEHQRLAKVAYEASLPDHQDEPRMPDLVARWTAAQQSRRQG
jgi:hypothetical protein